jgi:hypothetical protein
LRRKDSFFRFPRFAIIAATTRSGAHVSPNAEPVIGGHHFETTGELPGLRYPR